MSDPRSKSLEFRVLIIRICFPPKADQPQAEEIRISCLEISILLRVTKL